MQAAKLNGSDVQCNSFEGVRHLLHDYGSLKAKEYRYRANHYAQYKRSQHAPCHGTGSEQARQERDGKGKWRLFYKATPHSDEE